MKKIKYFFLLCLFALTSQQASAQDEVVVDAVVAVVNENVITQQDLDDRMSLALRHMGTIKLGEDEKRLFQAKVLGELINEELQLQYAEKAEIKAEPSEINMAIASIEKNNRLPQGAFYKISHGLEETAKRQVKSEVLWQKIVQSRVRPRINITNAELDLLIKNLTGEDIIEKEVQQIFLSPSDGLSEDELKKQVMSTYKKLQREPETFRATAQTMSEINASEGGYLGWFGPGELAPVIDGALSELEVGQISAPIRSQAGWHILKVSNQRTAQKFDTTPVKEVKVVRLSRTLSDDDVKAKVERKRFKKEVDDLERLSQIEGLIMKYSQDDAYIASYDMGWKKWKDLPEVYVNQLKKIEKGEFTKVFDDGKRITILYHDGERERMSDALLNYREKVRGRLIASRIDLGARRFMRDLRRQAYIDIRSN